MTTEFELTAADLQRASAAFIHYRERRMDQVIEILEDAGDAKRPLQFVLALMYTMNEVAAPAYDGEALTQTLHDFVLYLAAQEKTNG